MRTIARFYKEKSLQYLKQFPILCLLGPRQCGKTTFVKQYFQQFEYYDLERPSQETMIKNDVELFLKKRNRPFIIDEAQRFPDLFKALRSYVDENKKKGYVILLGSASFSLIKEISESLAGRVGYIDLSFFNLLEVQTRLKDFSLHWLKGGFPDAFLPQSETVINFDWYENYSRSLIERDWPALGIELDAVQFRRMWTMLAHSNGDILNKNKLAGSLGISPHTVERYIAILEQSFLVRRLPPFHANLKKRLIKSPKFYMRDTGLLHYFLRVLSLDDLYVSPERGMSFEGYVIEQISTYAKLNFPEFELFYFRTSEGIEVDLILVKGRTIIPIEIKCKSTITKEDIKSLEKVSGLLPLKKGYVVSLSEKDFAISDTIEVISIANFKKVFS